MLKKRIIPCLDVKDGRVVKGVNFVDLVDAGNPVEQAQIYEQQGADELTFLDITATSDNRGLILDIISEVAGKCFMPLTVGGGVRQVEDVKRLLNAGADKVSINSAAVKTPELVQKAAKIYGTQCIVVAIDSKKTGKTASGYEIFTHGGRTATGIDTLEWAQKMENYGAGEIMLTSMDADGTKQGFDIAVTKLVSSNVRVPVIASGGVGKLEHFADGITKGGAEAVLAASVFHFGQMSINEVKEYMKSQNIQVRL